MVIFTPPLSFLFSFSPYHTHPFPLPISCPYILINPLSPVFATYVLGGLVPSAELSRLPGPTLLKEILPPLEAINCGERLSQGWRLTSHSPSMLDHWLVWSCEWFWAGVMGAVSCQALLQSSIISRSLSLSPPLQCWFLSLVGLEWP